MPDLKLTVLSLRYSSWSMRPWIVLTHAGATFETETVALREMQQQIDADDDTADSTGVEPTSLPDRRRLGSVHGLFPVLRVDGVPIHESLAICEYVAESFPDAGLWPSDSIERAQARAICCEMVSGFSSLRAELSCHLFARVPDYSPSADTQKEIARIFEIWDECLSRSGGPFLFGQFSIADAIYFPVLTRFETYGVAVPESLAGYSQQVYAQPAVAKLIEIARHEPRTPIYDAYVRSLGGDPDGALNA